MPYFSIGLNRQSDSRPRAGIFSWRIMIDPTVERPVAEDGIYRAAVEHSVDGVFITVPDGRILYANPAACALLGATEEEILRKGRQGFSPAGDPRWERALDERARTGRTKFTAPMVRRDGSRFLADVTSSIFTEADGELRSIVIIRDVTARVRLENRSAALHEITGALLGSEDTASVLTMIARHAKALLEGSDAGIFTPGERPGSVRVTAVDGAGMSALQGREYPPGSLAARVMATREGVLVEDLSAAAATEDGRSLGLGPGIVVPIVADERVFGDLMVGAQPGSRPYGSADLEDLKVFAEAAGVALAMGEARSELEDYHRRTSGQLQTALTTRVVIEQAKGFIAATRGITTDEAFELLRTYARRHSEKIHDAARRVIQRTLTV